MTATWEDLVLPSPKKGKVDSAEMPKMVKITSQLTKRKWEDLLMSSPKVQKLDKKVLFKSSNANMEPIN